MIITSEGHRFKLKLTMKNLISHIFLSFLPTMKNSVCIDYLSFEWSSEDLIQAYRELKRQKSKTLYKILTSKDAKQLKKLHIEKNKQLRYENVLWRQINTNSLGLSNTLIDPCTLNW